jgi:hypothetical protein
MSSIETEFIALEMPKPGEKFLYTQIAASTKLIAEHLRGDPKANLSHATPRLKMY